MQPLLTIWGHSILDEAVCERSTIYGLLEKLISCSGNIQIGALRTQISEKKFDYEM